MDEIRRIELSYQERDADAKYRERYTYVNPLNLFSIQQQERAFLLALKRLGVDDLASKRVLDVGCGTGGVLLNYVRYGVRPENLRGIDLMAKRIDQARMRLPGGVSLLAQDGQVLPFADGSFDLISQWAVFSSILSYSVKWNMAREMLRCLAPGGAVLWCDMARIPVPVALYCWLKRQAKRAGRIIREPTALWQRIFAQSVAGHDPPPASAYSTSAVQAIPVEEIEALFPLCEFRYEYIIPWFEINEPIVRRSWFLAEALAASRVFSFWAFAVIQRRV